MPLTLDCVVHEQGQPMLQLGVQAVGQEAMPVGVDTMKAALVIRRYPVESRTMQTVMQNVPLPQAVPSFSLSLALRGQEEPEWLQRVGLRQEKNT